MTATPGVAVVTGAGRGIGRAVVWRLAADGWAVVASDGGGLGDLEALLGYRLGDKDDLAATVAGAPAGSRVCAVPADVRDPAAVTLVADEAAARFGGLDVAVAAAGVIAGGAPLWATPPAVLEALLAVNVAGVANLACCAVPELLRRPKPRQGRFIAVASAAAHRGLYHLAAYSASKAACVGLVRGLAADLRGTGITANVVSPGSTQTAMLRRTAELFGLPGPEIFAEHALLERLLEPEEVAAVVSFLCGGDSAALTGTVLAADAGFAEHAGVTA